MNGNDSLRELKSWLVAFGLLVSGAVTGWAQTATIRDIATDPYDPLNRADAEPSIAVNPTNPNNIAVVAFSGNWGPGGFGAPVWRSIDGGNGWEPDPIITQPPHHEQPPGPVSQKVAFDAAGHIFVVAEDADTTDFVYRPNADPSDATLTPGVAFGGDLQHGTVGAQPQLDVDRSIGLPCSNRLYSAWRKFFGGANAQSNVAYSVNNGVAMTNVAVGDNATFNNDTTRIALARDGSAYIIYKTREGAVTGVSLPGSTGPTDFENAHFVVQRSDDCGQTWNALGAAPVSVHGAAAVQTLFTKNFGVTAPGRKVARALHSDAWIAADPSDGDIYAAFVSRDASNFAQIYVARSTNRGVNWTTTRVTDGANHSAYPEVAVAATGTVGVLYIDFVNTPTNTLFRHRFARSFDDGATWNDQILQSMDPAPIANAVGGFLWGDHEGLTAQGNTFFGVFTGQSIGRTTLQLDPIFFTESAGTPTQLTVNAILVHPDPHYLHLFNLQIDGFTVRANANGGSTGPQIVAPGNHTVGETPGIGTHLLPRIIGGACADDGTVSLALGDNKFCTITIYDPLGGCPSQSICCEPGDDFEKCLVCSKPGQGCPGPP